MSKDKLPSELIAALDGPKGSLSAYLEVRNDAEIAADIRALASYCNTALRDEFAGKAMQGLMTSQNQDGDWTHDVQMAAQIAYQVADAMLQARKS